MQKNINYLADVLGNEFEHLTIDLPDDYEGKVKATLIRKYNNHSFNKAVLYIHGFNDYFFQQEMAEAFTKRNINFYALDLRKYGRSFLPHQKLNNVRNLIEYDEEIIEALKIIEAEGNNSVLLAGHSTGGLVVTYFAARHSELKIIKAVFANSPFYQFNVSPLELAIGIPLLSIIAEFFPDIKINSGLSDLYGKSLHKTEQGVYDYNLNWKPIKIPSVNLSFIRSIYKAQRFIRNNCSLAVPLLVMHSEFSTKPKKMNEAVFKTDIVLNAKHIKKYAQNIKGPVTIISIPNGIHDLVLSSAPVKEKVYEELFTWLSAIDF